MTAEGLRSFTPTAEGLRSFTPTAEGLRSLTTAEGLRSLRRRGAPLAHADGGGAALARDYTPV
jgi:hypothetical protein